MSFLDEEFDYYLSNVCYTSVLRPAKFQNCNILDFTDVVPQSFRSAV